MTRYEKAYEAISKIEAAMHRAKSESLKNMWFIKAEQMKYALHNSMTVKEAMQEV